MGRVFRVGFRSTVRPEVLFALSDQVLPSIDGLVYIQVREHL